MLGSLLSKILDFYYVSRDPVKYARSLGVTVGRDVRLISMKPGSGTFGSEPYLVVIGNHVTITGGVRFVTHDGGVWIFREEDPNIDVFGPIVVGNNVFIGYGGIILPNVKIGNNCVIAAGAIVSRDVPDGVVVAGIPAKTIKTIEEYAESIQDRKTSVRSLAYADKRQLLEQRFGMNLYKGTSQ